MPQPRRAPALLSLLALAAGCADGARESASAASDPTAATSVTGVSVSASASATASESGASEPTGGSGGLEAGETGPVATTDAPATTDVSTGDPGTSTGGLTTAPATTGGPQTTTGDPDTTAGTTGECAEIAEQAKNKKQPADILFVIDNSGSMQIEAASVKANMNQFSSKIVGSGIDVHVVLISALTGDTGMCIDAPLGSGGCPAKDTKLPTFLHINDSVGSNNPLQKLLDHHADWKDSMRPDASKHVVIVSDDDSDLGADAFDAAFKALDPSHAAYKLHAIVGQKSIESDPLWCFQNAQNGLCCGFTAAVGEVYIELIGKTDGVYGDLCKQDFKPVFDLLSTEVIQNAGLACEWTIPAPGGGEEIDYDKVNVDFDDGMGGLLPIGKVADPAACMDVADGWYYDDPNMPTKILVCPQTCAKIQLAPMAQMSIKFGCETIIAQ